VPGPATTLQTSRRCSRRTPPTPPGPWEGRDRIVEKWIDRGDAKRQWEFEHEILAVEGDTGVVRGLTHYPAQGEEAEEIYSNIWLIRLDPDGRAREFAEWWVEKPAASA
jgi:hypothetical protein